MLRSAPLFYMTLVVYRIRCLNKYYTLPYISNNEVRAHIAMEVLGSFVVNTTCVPSAKAQTKESNEFARK